MREMVIMFMPFRNEELNLLNQDRYIQLYKDNVETIVSRLRRYDCGLSEDRMLELMREVAERENVIDGVTVEGSVVDVAGPRVTTVEDRHVLRQPLRANNKDILTGIQRSTVRRIEKVMTSEEYCRLMRQLNDGQKALLLEFLNRLMYVRS